MKVLKFGGSSVGSAEGIRSLKRIVESQQEAVIVVVSALSGITDQLYKAAELAVAADEAYRIEYEMMLTRHLNLIEDVVLDQQKERVTEEVKALFFDLKNILHGISLIKDVSSRITDTLVAYGEMLSSLIVAGAVEGAEHFDSKGFIKTHEQFGKQVVDFPTSNRLIRESFSKEPAIAVCGGFISSDSHSAKVTNLGRGGSDYTAAILAAALGASCLEIWTDVDGFMTADPRIIDTAYVIEQLSFSEAMELCNFGAKVIYPPTIFPVFHKNIPLRIKNTFNPEAPGTCISDEGKLRSGGKAIKGISSVNDTSLITVQGLGMVGVIGVNYRIFRALAQNSISVFMVSQASSENTTSIAVKNADSLKAVTALREEFEEEMAQGEISRIFSEDDLATIAIVGDNMKRTPGIAGKLFGTLGRNGINVVACAQGASETNISFVTDRVSLRKALNVIHDSFFLSEYQALNLFVVGVGTVGGSLLEQIKKQQPKLMKQNGLKLEVVGIASSKKCCFAREGIDLENYRQALEEGAAASAENICREILQMNIFNSVFVDCTASKEVAALYQILLDNNVSVVTANKLAASSAYENYSRLKESARRRGVKFLFETNVGAGLPIISTINSLINSGDHILRLEAVLSGTLNFIFNSISPEVSLSQAIRMAQQAGYSEPDPRIDLSGQDVIRKLVILAREAGYCVEQDEVERQLFIPETLFRGSVEDFWQNISSLDKDFESKRRELDAQGKRWRFVASMEAGKCRVGLQAVDRKHPFFDLQGSNNIVLITTERYNEYPMIIKGYGAGAGVTAAGVFSDIISIANVR